MTDYTPIYPCDLHPHTTRSDGNDSYQELIDKAAALKMKVIAITDHDVLPQETIDTEEGSVSVEQYGFSKGVQILRGIEISCDTMVDDVHIIGLGCDFSSPKMKAFVESMSDSKLNAYKKLVQVLAENGIGLTWELVLENAGKPLTDDQVQRKHIFEAIARTGHTKDWSEAKLMVRDNPTYNVRREKIDPLDAIDLIHSAGGMAILAHPFLIDEEVCPQGETISREAYIEKLISRGLDGIEAAYTYHKTTYKGTHTPEEIENIIRDKYEGRLKVISGGSDYHADEKKGMAENKARKLGEKGISYEYLMQNSLLTSIMK